ncbi:hypothetical protein [Thauera sp. Sel9]|uniref:hypothetical protein n=1 Tax=Thauera sp. Sel9 TaxID=2974299 RepID=UPI0021E150BB|nr:hypothetical protein [Thauera sp. Sel9]
MLDGLERIGLPVPVSPDGAFHVYFDVSDTGMTSWQFCQRVLEEVHATLTPGKDFGHCSANVHVRLSHAASIGDLEEAIRHLDQFMNRLNAERTS